jgi:transposase
MIVLGVDPHKDVLVVVAVDSNGRQLDTKSAAARPRGV